jgi:hypothetical protein
MALKFELVPGRIYRTRAGCFALIESQDNQTFVGFVARSGGIKRSLIWASNGTALESDERFDIVDQIEHVDFPLRKMDALERRLDDTIRAVSQHLQTVNATFEPLELRLEEALEANDLFTNESASKRFDELESRIRKLQNQIDERVHKTTLVSVALSCGLVFVFVAYLLFLYRTRLDSVSERLYGLDDRVKPISELIIRQIEIDQNQRKLVDAMKSAGIAVEPLRHIGEAEK